MKGSRTAETKANNREKISELCGKLKFQNIDNKLMHLILENDKETVENGKLIGDAINAGLGAITPSIIMKQMAKNYSLAENIYGESFLKELTGEGKERIEKNINIPEYQKELLKRMNEKLELLEEKGLTKDSIITEQAYELASVILYMEELDNLMPTGIAGEKAHKKSHMYGLKEEVREYKKERYRDIAIRKSVKRAVRRKHKKLIKKDLMAFERQSKGQCSIIYALDASGSMRGEKIKQCKKAGIALAYKAVEEKDKVGIIVFGEEVRTAVNPTTELSTLLKEIIKIRAKHKTNLKATLEKASEMFPKEKGTKHLILITDAMPTAGKEPEEETLEAASAAKSRGITISIAGISLNEEGEKLAKRIVEIGEGRLYAIKDLKELDKIVLEDYYSVI